jgi:trigger factor
MDFRVDPLGPCRKKVSVIVPAERVQEEFERQYQEINKNLVLPGFRKGRAPRKVLEKRFASHIGPEVKEGLVKAALEKLLEEKKVDPLAPPQIDVDALALDPAKALEFEFECVTKPEFETPTYKGLEVKVPAPSVLDEEVQQAVDAMRRRRAKLELAPEGAALEEGDVAVVDWEARSGDSVEARDEGVYYKLGRGVLADFVAEGLDDALRAKAPGTTVTVKVHVAPDDPREELRGKEMDLVVTLKEVRRYLLPPIDAEFLKTYDFEDESELREDVRKKVLRMKRRRIEQDAEEKLVEQLLGAVEMSLPADFVDREIEAWAARRRMTAQMEGVADEEATKQLDAARADAKTQVEHDMRRFFLLDRIAEAEGIEATKEEMAQAIEEIATTYGHPIEEVMATFRDQGRLAELRSQIRHRKVKESIRQTARLVEQAPEASPPDASEPEEPRASGKKKSR